MTRSASSSAKMRSATTGGGFRYHIGLDIAEELSKNRFRTALFRRDRVAHEWSGAPENRVFRGEEARASSRDKARDVHFWTALESDDRGAVTKYRTRNDLLEAPPLPTTR